MYNNRGVYVVKKKITENRFEKYNITRYIICIILNPQTAMFPRMSKYV